MVYVDNERKRDLGKVWRSIYGEVFKQIWIIVILSLIIKR